MGYNTIYMLYFSSIKQKKCIKQRNPSSVWRVHTQIQINKLICHDMRSNERRKKSCKWTANMNKTHIRFDPSALQSKRYSCLLCRIIVTCICIICGSMNNNMNKNNNKTNGAAKFTRKSTAIYTLYFVRCGSRSFVNTRTQTYTIHAAEHSYFVLHFIFFF